MLRRIVVNLVWWLFFKPRGRNIFAFHDGQRWRRADPMVVYRGFASHPGFDWEADPITLAHAGEGTLPESAILKASERMATAVRDILEIPPVSEGGLTEAECHELYGDFTRYVAGVKKNSSQMPTGPQPTEPPVSDSSITKPASVSTSTSGDKPSGAATSPGSESTGPSTADPAAMA